VLLFVDYLLYIVTLSLNINKWTSNLSKQVQCVNIVNANIKYRNEMNVEHECKEYTNKYEHKYGVIIQLWT